MVNEHNVHCGCIENRITSILLSVQHFILFFKLGSQSFLGPSQSAPGQYPNYPQGQGQQYGGYRPPQPGPPQGQQQRPYGYDQVSITAALDGPRNLTSD